MEGTIRENNNQGRSHLEKNIASSLNMSVSEIPKLRVRTVFISHVSENDAKKLKSQGDFDIVLIEGPGSGGSKSERIIQDIALGERPLTEIDNEEHPFFKGVAKEFSDTGTFIRFTDARRGSSFLEEEILPLVGMYQEFGRLTYENQLSLESAIHTYAQFMKDFSETMLSKRENLIAHEEVPRAISEVIKGNKSLLEKDTLDIAVVMGSTHTTLHDIMKRVHPGVERQFGVLPFFFSRQEEHLRRLTRDLNVSEQLVFRSFFEMFMGNFILAYLKEKETLSEISREKRVIVDRFSDDDLREFYNIVVIQQNIEGGKMFVKSRLSPQTISFNRRS